MAVIFLKLFDKFVRDICLVGDVDLFMSRSDVEENGLHCLQVKYMQGKRFYMATTFATVAWMASDIADVDHGQVVEISDSLQDYAAIKEFDSAVELRNYPFMSRHLMSEICKSVELKLADKASCDLMKRGLSIADKHIVWLPYPGLVCTIVDSCGNCLGAYMFYMDGTAEQITRFADECGRRTELIEECNLVVD